MISFFGGIEVGQNIKIEKATIFMIALNYCKYGAEGRNRTTDTGIFSHLLYRLSYLGMKLFDVL